MICKTLKKKGPETPQKRPGQESQATQGRCTSSLRSGVQELMTPKEARPSQLEIDDPPQLRWSNRVKKPNPKYIDADLAQIEDIPTLTLDQETGWSRERTRKLKIKKNSAEWKKCQIATLSQAFYILLECMVSFHRLKLWAQFSLDQPTCKVPNFTASNEWKAQSPRGPLRTHMHLH